MFCFIIDYSKVEIVIFLRLSNYLNILRICIKQDFFDTKTYKLICWNWKDGQNDFYKKQKNLQI